MKHLASPKFWALYEALPSDIRELADKNYQLLKLDSRHPSLRFKKIGDLWSIRIGLQYRALATEMTGISIGSGSEPTLRTIN